MDISPKTLTEITFKDIKVITTDLLGVLYETESRRITENFNRNIDRFIAGIHYHKLTNGDLKEFKSQYAESVVVEVPQNTAHLYLWTKRGIARHAKILDTDKAWDVFDELEEYYFNRGKNIIQIDTSKNQPELLQYATDLSKKLKEQAPLVMIAESFLESSTLKTVLQVSKELGIGEKTLFKILREEKVFYYTWQNGSQVNVPYETHKKAGRFEVKNKTKQIKRSDGSVQKINYSQIRVTAKGEAFICALLERRGTPSK